MNNLINLNLYIGERVLVEVESGAKYEGRIFRYGNDHIVLSELCIINCVGGRIASKTKKPRKLAIKRIKSINFTK